MILKFKHFTDKKTPMKSALKIFKLSEIFTVIGLYHFTIDLQDEVIKDLSIADIASSV